jgi:hypothetical protein
MSTAIRIDRLDKNYLINGGLDFFQRGGVSGSVNLSTTPTYVAADRFKMSYTGTVTGTPNAQQVASTMSPQRARYAVQLNGRRNSSTLTFTMEQRLEGFEARELAYAGSASFSIWVFTPITGCSVRLTLNTPTAEDNYTSVTQLSQQTSSTTIAASTWTKISFSNLSISSAANNGLAVVVDLQIPSGTDGSAQNHLMTQFMLNAGTTASDFVRAGAHIGRELALCQRYYQTLGVGMVGFVDGVTSTIEFGARFVVPMRSSPTSSLLVTSLSAIGYPSGGQNHFVANPAGFSAGTLNNLGFSRFQITGFGAGLTAGNGAMIEINGSPAEVFGFDAEL